MQTGPYRPLHFQLLILRLHHAEFSQCGLYLIGNKDKLYGLVVSGYGLLPCF